MAARTQRRRRGKTRGVKPRTGLRLRLIKGIVLCSAAALSLGAGIYKGGEGLFFGVVFAIACGLMGILYIKQENGTTKTGKG